MLKYKKIFENEEFLVVNKPAGLLTHGTESSDEETLAGQLLKDYPEIEKVGEDPTRPGIMHRLDRHVSGLLVIAKNQASFYNLKEQFQKRTIQKHYTALVYGKVSKDEDEINFPIQRSSKGYKMAALPATDNGQPNDNGRKATTEFFVKKRYINYTLLDVKIKTGRTHQIRAHLAAYGHPIVGDDLYGTKKTKIKNKKLNPGRIFLTAYKLSFLDTENKKHTFNIELPEELKNFLKIAK